MLGYTSYGVFFFSNFEVSAVHGILSQKREIPLCRKTLSEVTRFAATVGATCDVDRSWESPAKLPIPSLCLRMVMVTLGFQTHKRPDH